MEERDWREKFLDVSFFVGVLADIFIESINYCRSVECFLIKLSSIVDRIEDWCRYSKYTPSYVFNTFISMPRVSRVLSPLACYIDDVRSLAQQIRFKKLSNYIPLLLNHLVQIPCSNPEKIREIERPPMYILEHTTPHDIHLEVPYHSHSRGHQDNKRGPSTTAVIGIIIASIIALLVLLKVLGF